MAFKRVQKKREGVRGRTDLGLAKGEAGVYQLVQETTDREGITRRKTRTVYRLRRITDGELIDVEDDGVGDGGAMLAGRSRLRHLLSKTVEVNDGERSILLPFVFVDKPPPPQLSRVGPIPVPVANDQIMAVMADLCGDRRARMLEARKSYEAQRTVAEAEEAMHMAAAKKRRKRAAQEGAEA